jgi:hypothetical protein
MRFRLSAITVFVFAAFVAAGAQPPVTGNAIVDVTVVDGLGAPLEGVTVKLRGVVDRDATTNDVGMVAFEELPSGRYDVVAMMKGLASNLPRVVDVPPFGQRAVAVALKPVRLAGGMMACGGFDPNSIKTLAASTHRILHIKVMDQDMIQPASDRDYVSTLNRVRLLESFTRGLIGVAGGSMLTIRQGGGRIDRGDYIDTYSFNSLPPLNVGDEYVLFIHVGESGAHTIIGSEEGAFRIRNGRVEPQGNAGAASTWRGQPASTFFQALRVLRH